MLFRSMANTGSVRATEVATLSGIAMETEFQLLNAKLSEKADNLQLAEEQLWELYAEYQGMSWNGDIEYPGSFNIRDTSREFQQLQTAKAAATSPAVTAVIDYKIMEALGEEPEEIVDAVTAYLPAGAVDVQAVGTTAVKSEIEEYQKWRFISPDGSKVEDTHSPAVRDEYLAQGWIEV